MSKKTSAVTKKSPVLNVVEDIPDIRDRYFEPNLRQLPASLDNRNVAPVLSQGSEGSCTGQGLATVINLLQGQRSESSSLVSARMLYEMAKFHDQWPGEEYQGSSCRAAIKGWKNMGVCSEDSWPYVEHEAGQLSIEKAKSARNTSIGAYYRLRPELSDYHSAINETGALYVSATVHDNWYLGRSTKNLPLILPGGNTSGGHAFALVGYNTTGFIVQNSWGENWGLDGHAVWLYEDWYENIMDGWAFRLGVSTPQVFGRTAAALNIVGAEGGKKKPKRSEIAGHFVHFDDGKLKSSGDYWSNLHDIEVTAKKITTMAENNKVKHLLIYAHGGLNSPRDSANRIYKLKDRFLENGIYPVHMMYDTGLAETLKDLILARHRRTEGWFGNLKRKISDLSDQLIEKAIAKPGAAFWEEMKRDAKFPFDEPGDDGVKVLSLFVDALASVDVKIHLAGHSTGGVLIGHLLDAADRVGLQEIETCTLMAPACSIDFYKRHYAKRLDRQFDQTRLKNLTIYNLDDKHELDDHVAKVYRKSLLYLVSNAFERTKHMPLLGMQKFSKSLSATRLKVYYASGSKSKVTQSTSHGGFDNDLSTMNHMLNRILGTASEAPFTALDMKDY